MINKLNFTFKFSISFIVISILLFLFNYDHNSDPYFYGSGLPFTPSIFRFNDFYEISSIGFSHYEISATNYFPFGILVVNLIFLIFGPYSVVFLFIVFILILMIVVFNFFEIYILFRSS